MANAYLTIDDAPSSDLPDKIVVLDKYDVPAMFFCEGRRLVEHPDFAQQAIEAGYHLGNHSYSHSRTSELSVEAFREEIERTEFLIEDAYDRAGVDRPGRTFRFPFGERGEDRSASFQRILQAWEFTPPDPEPFTYSWYEDHHSGMVDWFWTISVEDWNVNSTSDLRKNVERFGDRFDESSSDIVLFHDAGNTSTLFEHFLELLLVRGVTFEDPLALLT